MKFYVMLAVFFVILGGLSGGGWYLWHSGYDARASEDKDAIAKRDLALSELKGTHKADLARFQAKLDSFQRRSKDELGRLLAENKALKDWWQTPVPSDAARFAWGLLDDTDARTLPAR